MKDYSCELGAACGPEAAAGRELAAVRKRRCVAEEAQVAGEGDELLLLLFVRAVVRDDAHLFGYVGEARHLIASGRLGAADVLPRFGRERHSITPMCRRRRLKYLGISGGGASSPRSFCKNSRHAYGRVL